MVNGDWGTAREGAARRRRRTVLAAIAALAAMAVLVLPFVSGGRMVIGPDQPAGPAPAWLRVAAGVALIAVMLVVARINWLGADEVRRASIGRFWAVIGFATCASFPLMFLIGPLVTDRDRLTVVYMIALTAGCVDSAWRRWRGEAVWG